MKRDIVLIESVQKAVDVLRCFEDALTGSGTLTQISFCLPFGKRFRTLAQDVAEDLELHLRALRSSNEG